MSPFGWAAHKMIVLRTMWAPTTTQFSEKLHEIHIHRRIENFADVGKGFLRHSYPTTTTTTTTTLLENISYNLWPPFSCCSIKTISFVSQLGMHAIEWVIIRSLWLLCLFSSTIVSTWKAIDWIRIRFQRGAFNPQRPTHKLLLTQAAQKTMD